MVESIIFICRKEETNITQILMVVNIVNYNGNTLLRNDFETKFINKILFLKLHQFLGNVKWKR